MLVAKILDKFRSDVSECNDLIQNIHLLQNLQPNLISQTNKEKITISAFLNIFIGWEEFLETSLIEFMMGKRTILGHKPRKYISPPNKENAKLMLIGNNRYYDFGNHSNLKTTVNLLFKDGYPYSVPLSSINVNLDDIRTMRNASAHISSSTQKSLESVAQRLLRIPQPNIKLYDLLISIDPQSSNNETIFFTHKEILLTAAELIANG